MAVSSTVNRVVLQGNGSSVVFAFPYYFFSQNDLVVNLYDTIAGSTYLQALNSNYTVSGTPSSTGLYPSGANIIFASSVVSTSYVVIERNPVQQQNFTLLQTGTISSQGLTQEMDYLTLLIQRQQDQNSRSVRLPDGDGSNFNPTLPSGPALNPGATMVINASGTAFIWEIPSGGSGGGGTGSSVLAIAGGGTGTSTPPTGYSVIISNANGTAYTSTGAPTSGYPLMGQPSGAPGFTALSLSGPGISGVLPTSAGGTGNGSFAGNLALYSGSSQISESTTTALELSYVHGVTSSIQTQLSALAPLANPTFAGAVLIPDGSTPQPGLAFANESQTGWERIGTGNPRFSVIGSSAIDILRIGLNMNFGFGIAAANTSSTPWQVVSSLNGAQNFTYANVNNGTSSITILQIGNGSGSNYTTLENWANFSTGYLAGGSLMGASSLQAQLNLTAENPSGTMRFNVGGRTLASEAMRIGVTGTGGLTLNQGWGQLNLSGANSGVASIIAASSSTTFNFNLPSGPGTSGQVLTSQGGGSTAMTWATPGVTTGSSIPNAFGLAEWDTNLNMSANSMIEGCTTTVTSAGTTTLTVSSPPLQIFTGTNSQTVLLPVTSTLVVGQKFEIFNYSSGSVAVQSSGGNQLSSLTANKRTIATCMLTSGTGTASWAWETYTLNGGAMSVSLGGTSSTSVVSAPAASAWAGWDANKNFSANNHISGYTTNTTAGGTTALLVGSTAYQFFTGTQTQTVQLPVTSTLALGLTFNLINVSSGNVTVQSSGGNNLQVMAQSTVLAATCILTTGTTAASWSWSYNPLGQTALPMYNPMTFAGQLIEGGASGTPAVVAAGAVNSVLISAGSSVSFGFQTAPTKQLFTSAPTGGSITGYLFVVSGISVAPTAGATYTNNSNTFTVIGTTNTNTLLWCTFSGAATFSGTTLTKTSGTGDSTVTFQNTTTNPPQPLGTYTTPTTARWIKVTLVGGGGGGGGVATATSGGGASSGGSGGATCIKWISSPAATYYYTYGYAGGGGNAGANVGTAGGYSGFGSGTTFYTAGPGLGGASSTASTTVTTGVNSTGPTTSSTASGGDLNIPGGPGAGGVLFSTSQVQAGYGGSSSAAPTTLPGAGGTSTGAAGLGYGGGGGGGSLVSGGSSQAGGNGMGGFILSEEYSQ